LWKTQDVGQETITWEVANGSRRGRACPVDGKPGLNCCGRLCRPAISALWAESRAGRPPAGPGGLKGPSTGLPWVRRRVQFKKRFSGGQTSFSLIYQQLKAQARRSRLVSRRNRACQGQTAWQGGCGRVKAWLSVCPDQPVKAEGAWDLLMKEHRGGLGGCCRGTAHCRGKHPG